MNTLISKENKEVLIAPTNFPEKPPKIRPTKKQIEETLNKTMKDFREIDIPRLRKKFPPPDGDTLKIVINT